MEADTAIPQVYFAILAILPFLFAFAGLAYAGHRTNTLSKDLLVIWGLWIAAAAVVITLVALAD